jgi:hypothetical protein
VSIQHHRMLTRLPFVITKYRLPARITVIAAIAATTAATATTITTIVTIATTTITTVFIAARTACRPLGLEAVTTINRTVFTRNKWYRGWTSTGRTGGLIMFTATRAGSRRLPSTTGSTATRATARCVCQSAAGIKLLFASSKCKVLTTVTTGEDTILVSFIGHHG